MAKKKKPSRRDNTKYPMFDPSLSPKVRREYMDVDYIDKLSEEPTIEMPDGSIISEKEWLHKFLSERDGASLDFKNLENNLHNTKELKKDCTDRNNARNRCLYGVSKANRLVHDPARPENDTKPSDTGLYEDLLITYIDKKNEE